MLNIGKDLAEQVLKPENVAKLKAAALETLQNFARSNVVRIDVSDDDAGFHFSINIIPKGTP